MILCASINRGIRVCLYIDKYLIFLVYGLTSIHISLSYLQFSTNAANEMCVEQNKVNEVYEMRILSIVLIYVSPSNVIKIGNVS